LSGEFPGSTEFLLVGSGIAGLQAALLAREHGPVTVLTKTALSETNTYHAQGGIAVATGVDDNPDLHFQDTITAGAGLCDPAVVRTLVDEGPDAVRCLIDTGVNSDMRAGELLRGLEAAHSVPRVLHAAGAQPLARKQIQQIMWENVGMFRDRERLRGAAEDLLGGLTGPSQLTRAAIENANLTLAGLFAAHAAYGRPERRGAHFRLDFPEPEPDLARPALFRIADPAPLTLPTSDS
jgi:aspartate oxidase